MAKPRELEPGAYYHVGTRGSRRAFIRWDDDDYAGWLRLLGRVTAKNSWTVLGFTMMGNHFHVVLRDSGTTLSAGMRELNGVYARRTNARYGWDAHLFRNRFWSSRLLSDERLRGALRYVDLNPVEERLTAHPADWPYGSYAAVIGVVEPPAFLAVDALLALFGRDRKTAIARYRSFVEGDDPVPSSHVPWSDQR